MAGSACQVLVMGSKVRFEEALMAGEELHEVDDEIATVITRMVRMELVSLPFVSLDLTNCFWYSVSVIYLCIDSIAFLPWYRITYFYNASVTNP